MSYLRAGIFLLAFGFFLAGWHQRARLSGEWVANRDLPINTRISSNDLRKPINFKPYLLLTMPKLGELEGKYVATNGITNGSRVMVDILRPLPELQESPGEALFFLAPQNLGAAPALLNAGRHVRVFESTNRAIEYGPYVVAAVLTSPTNCTVLRVPAADVDQLRALSKPEIRLGGNLAKSETQQNTNWISLRSVTVPSPPGAVWTPALEVLGSNRLYRLRVTGGTWKVNGVDFSADGAWTPTNLICPTVAYGALIAKAGGSTADTTGSLFGIGRHCVLQLPTDGKAAVVYLGANAPTNAAINVTGSLTVEIEAAQ